MTSEWMNDQSRQDRAPEHIHTNPSPSHEVRAWCNGAGYDAPEHLRGCGQCVSLSSFADGPHDSYLQDVRLYPHEKQRLQAQLSSLTEERDEWQRLAEDFGAKVKEVIPRLTEERDALTWLLAESEWWANTDNIDDYMTQAIRNIKAERLKNG